MPKIEPKKVAWDRGAVPRALGRWLRLAPKIPKYCNKTTLVTFLARLNTHIRENRTYSNQKNRKSCSDSQYKDESEEGRGVFGGLPEDVVDLRLLAISEGGRNRWRRRKSVLLDLDIKGIGNQTLGRAKGSDNDSCVEGPGGREERGRNFLLGLCSRNLISLGFNCNRGGIAYLRHDIRSSRCPCRYP